MSATIYYGDESYAVQDGESVLDCLLRSGVAVQSSCRAGVCQSCLVQAVDGTVPDKAQEGLKATYKERGLFLACQCIPQGDMSVRSLEDAGVAVEASVVSRVMLNHNVVKLVVQPSEEVFEAQPGQYLTLVSPDDVARSYSIANDPAVDERGAIELHIRLIDGGAMSGWVRDVAAVGDVVSLRGPAGNCFYSASEGDEYPIVLGGTGTGLAPLYGIAHAALARGHRGAIALYHGALAAEDLYLVEALQALDAAHENFTYVPCVLNGEAEAFYRCGDVSETIMAAMPEEKADVRLFLCGAPAFVNGVKMQAFMAGVASGRIYVDAFLESR